MTVEGQRRQSVRTEWIAEIVTLLVLGAMAAAVALSSLGYSSGSILYPLMISSLLLLFVLVRLAALALEGGRTGVATAAALDADDEGPREDLSLRAMVIYAAAIVALVASLQFVWFPIAASLAGTVVLRWVYGASWRLSLLGAVLVSISSSLVFWGLSAPLPGPGV